MSFGYRDQDWVDPEEDKIPDNFRSKCADCEQCSMPPENAGMPVYAYCLHLCDWVDPYEVVDYNYNCFVGCNKEME